MLGQHRLIHGVPDDQVLEVGGILVQGDLMPGPNGTPLHLHRENLQGFLHSERPVTFMYTAQQRLEQHLGVLPPSAGLHARVDAGYDLLRW